MKDDGGFHVYTLHIKTDNTFDLYIDTEVVSSGSLLEDMKPPLVPPEEIDDPEDKQPDDWVTEVCPHFWRVLESVFVVMLAM